MNRQPDVELVLRAYLADEGDIAPDRILEVVAERIASQPRRLASRLPWRNTMNGYLKLVAGLAAALVVGVVGYNLLPGFGGSGGQSTPIPSPTAPPSPPNSTSSPAATGPIDLPDGTLTGGRYRIQPLPEAPSLSIVADVPAGWLGHPAYPALTGRTTEEPPDGILIGFMSPDGLFSDPCHWDLDGTGSIDQPGDIEVGPTVDDLVAALNANASYTSSAATPVSLGEYRGQRLELRLPGTDVLSTCDGEEPAYFVFSTGYYSQGPNSLWDLFIVDVDGTRLITMVSYFPGTPPADVAAARAIVESFQITP